MVSEIRVAFRGLVGLLIACVLLVGSVAAQAQQSGYAKRSLEVIKSRNSASYYSVPNLTRRNLASGISQVGVVGVNRRSFLGSSNPRRPAPKPFSSINRGSTVSPYLSLGSSLNSTNDYYNLVRPQQQQRRRNEQVQRQLLANQQRLGQMSAQAPYNPRGNEDNAPTGHTAVFQSLGSYLTTGNYFPPPTAPKNQR